MAETRLASGAGRGAGNSPSRAASERAWSSGATSHRGRSATPPGLLVRFWGVRGSIPAPGPRTVRFGGNTSCVSIELEPDPASGAVVSGSGDGRSSPLGDVYVFDAGSGIRELGLDLARLQRLPISLHLFLTHTHWDHIQGFPFFVPAFIPGNRLQVHGLASVAGGLEGVLAGQMLYQYFPVSLPQLGADLEFMDIEVGATHDIAAARVTTGPLRHTGPTVGYRLELAGCSVAYITDTECPGGPNDSALDPVVLELARGADLLIHDAQYTDEEYHARVGWGHSPLSYVVRMAVAAEARRLALFHHDPTHDDVFVAGMVEKARHLAQATAGNALEVMAAADGLELVLAGAQRS